MHCVVNTKLFWFFFAHGLLSIIFTQTWFVPDEYWQVTEIAHSLVFGYGYRTWEWLQGIRSGAYPLIIAIVYWILKLLSLDHILLLIYLPRILQVFLSSMSYVCLCDLAKILYGSQARIWTAFSLASSWSLFYCMNRTLYNALETVLAIFGLYLFPWTVKKCTFITNSWKYMMIVAFSIIVRPTILIFWIPLCIYHIVNAVRQHVFMTVCWIYIVNGIMAICAQLLIDYVFYKRILFTPYLFIKFNIMNDLSSHYGVHPWHWYWTQGIPLLLTTHLIPLVLAIWKKPKQPLFFLSLWMIFTYSFLGHKEFRFILPIVPCGMVIIGSYLDQLAKKSCRKSFWIIFNLFITNIPLALYLGIFHQRGSLDVMKYLHSIAKEKDDTKVLFLMPCHSTPYYSHLHENISLDFLTCEPNLLGESNYVDEADQFYQNPLYWMNSTFRVHTMFEDLKSTKLLPTHIVMYDSLSEIVGSFLEQYDFVVCKQFFHTHFPQDRVSRYIQVACKKRLN